jgi:hypothetical protein
MINLSLMSRHKFFLPLAFLLILVSVLAPGVLAQAGSYSVSGYVFDDENGNGRYDCSFGYCEKGIGGKRIYVDHTWGPSTYTDSYGYWILNNVSSGRHSIEIEAAGSGGSKPTTAEKFIVNGPSNSIRYGIQQGGYAVEGYVRDASGNPVAGAQVYTDFPNRQSVITNSSGYYRIDNVGYDQSTPVYGHSGGHNIYVQGYEANPVLVNPQYTAVNIPANFTVQTDQSTPSCGAGYARNPQSPASCGYFSNLCVIPSGWIRTGNCNQNPFVPINPAPQCPINAQAGAPRQDCNRLGQLCTLIPTYGTNCQISDVELEFNCQPLTPGVCGYQSNFYQPVYTNNPQCSPGQPVGGPFEDCRGDEYCTSITNRYKDSSCSSTYRDYQGCQRVSGKCGYYQSSFIQQENYQTYQQPNYQEPVYQQPVYEQPQSYGYPNGVVESKISYPYPDNHGD